MTDVGIFIISLQLQANLLMVRQLHPAKIKQNVLILHGMLDRVKSRHLP